MTVGGEFQIHLDDNILENIASLICGDDTTEYYRQGYQIVRFFKAAGWTEVGDLDGYRKSWTLEKLQERRQNSEAIRAVLVRLADPREYLDEDETRVVVVEELNRLLAFEGYQVIYERGRPTLIEQDLTVSRITMQRPAELTVSLVDIVSHADFGTQLQARLDEAYICWKSGAPTAAIIMLGSLLEGVLYDVAASRYSGGKKPTDHLQSLIATARDNKWIAREVAEYSDVLRNHRNLVHPKKQLTDSYAPDDDVVQIAWNVVVAALNDLAVLPPPADSARS
jgi:hypothetical protein